MVSGLPFLGFAKEVIKALGPRESLLELQARMEATGNDIATRQTAYVEALEGIAEFQESVMPHLILGIRRQADLIRDVGDAMRRGAET